ncbi:MAG: GntR family transcriptional regulator [Pikeienuella sp.]
MTERPNQTWRSVYGEVQRRIYEQVWQAGEIIPTEAELAQEFGCARTTVNRALRQLAETGLIDRRRKAGTRVVINPIRRAVLSIPMIRKEIEDRGETYGYSLLSQNIAQPPEDICNDLTRRFLHIRAIHLANDSVYVFEDRWVDLHTTPEIEKADLRMASANEWLLNNAPYTSGEITFHAENASESDGAALKQRTGTAVLIATRRTWSNGDLVTVVRLVFAPGYTMKTTIER